MTWANVAVGVGSVVAGVYGSNKAAGAQEGAANNATKLYMAAQGQNRADMLPYMQTGLAGNELLNAYMGIDTPMLTREQLAAQLAPKYSYIQHKDNSWTGKLTGANPLLSSSGVALGLGGVSAGADLTDATLGGGIRGTNNTRVNTYALNKAIDKAMAAQQEAYNARHANPNFGLLSKRFTNEDFVKDPGYDFRMQQGELGVNRGLATRGGYFSGAALKELGRYDQNFASNEFNQAAQRDAEYKANMYNRLAGMAHGGQQSAQYMGNYGQNAAANMGQNAMAGAQAQGAGYMAGANALASGLNNGYNAWQGQQYINALNKKA